MKHNKKKTNVTGFKIIPTTVMMLLVLILPYQPATNNIRYETKQSLRLNASMGTIIDGYINFLMSIIIVLFL